MAIKIIEERICDWCDGDDPDGLRTHRLVLDRKAVEVEVHEACIEDATVAYLLSRGRKPTPEQIAQAVNEMRCPVDGCGKSASGSMGLAQHMARSHGDIPPLERRELIASVKEAAK